MPAPSVLFFCTICAIFVHNYTQCSNSFSLWLKRYVRKGIDAKNRYRGGHGFESRWSPDHSSLSSMYVLPYYGGSVLGSEFFFIYFVQNISTNISTLGQRHTPKNLENCLLYSSQFLDLIHCMVFDLIFLLRDNNTAISRELLVRISQKKIGMKIL